VGKNTIIKELLTNHPRDMSRLITYTTRPPRSDEVEGEQYHFVAYEEFRRLAMTGKLMEANATTSGHDVYDTGHLYSMPADIYQDMLPDRHILVAEVDILGMRRLREREPGCITIFLTAPPLVLLERIRERRDEHMDAKNMAQRMQTAHDQMSAAGEFDYIVFNEDGHLHRTIQAIEGIILAERRRVRHNVDLLASVPAEAFAVVPDHP
jgi:guanylate kinase